MKLKPEASEYRYDAVSTLRSGSLNLSPALNVLSNTARVKRLRILMRTSVCPPRAVGFETSTSMQWYGAPSCSKNILRLISIASIWVAIGGIRCHVSGGIRYQVSGIRRYQVLGIRYLGI